MTSILATSKYVSKAVCARRKNEPTTRGPTVAALRAICRVVDAAGSSAKPTLDIALSPILGRAANQPPWAKASVISELPTCIPYFKNSEISVALSATYLLRTAGLVANALNCIPTALPQASALVNRIGSPCIKGAPRSAVVLTNRMAALAFAICFIH